MCCFLLKRLSRRGLLQKRVPVNLFYHGNPEGVFLILIYNFYIFSKRSTSVTKMVAPPSSTVMGIIM